ncbi:MAG: hypothetical protein JW734_07790 [Candidatus Omnitrophica bacterium]|nr:hypothetical protein [Candidatus Omnitrophota bacterium]
MNKVSRVTLVLGSLLFTLVLAEIILRAVDFECDFYPSKVQFGWPNPVMLEHLYEVDRQLLWVSKDYSAKIDAWRGKEPSIVFMGCSCTEVGSYDKLLKKIIDTKHPGNNFTYVNVGVGGWSSYQGLQQLKRDVVSMKPKVITIYYGWNDHWHNFGIEDKDIGRFNLENQILAAKLSRLRTWQLVNSFIFELKQLGSKKKLRRSERVALADFVSNIYDMVQIARENDIVPVLITAPSSHVKGREPNYLSLRCLDNLGDLIPLHYRYIQAVRKVVNEYDVELIDLALEFSKLPQADLNNLFLQDGIHLTDEGSKRVAGLMYEYFVNSGLIDRILKED